MDVYAFKGQGGNEASMDIRSVSGKESGMNAERAIELAEAEAKKEGWLWFEPVAAYKQRRWVLFGRVSWLVTSNADKRGCNVRVRVDDASGRIVDKGFAPR